MKLLKFGAVWCSGCLVMKPRLAEIESEMPWLESIYYDYDENVKEVRMWDVSDILPTFIFVDKNGEEILRLNGEQPKDKLVQLIMENKDK